MLIDYHKRTYELLISEIIERSKKKNTKSKCLVPFVYMPRLKQRELWIHFNRIRNHLSVFFFQILLIWYSSSSHVAGANQKEAKSQSI